MATQHSTIGKQRGKGKVVQPVRPVYGEGMACAGKRSGVRLYRRLARRAGIPPFGRERARDSSDEMMFGISRERFVARMKHPLPGTQFTGIITGIAEKSFESGLVDAVVTLHRSREDYFMPVPVLAQSTDEILAGGGSKPVLAQTLVALEKACKLGLKRLLVIGASCHVHNLREFQRRFSYIRDMDLYTVGIPCTDNVHPKNFRFILSRISRSHETVRHYEIHAGLHHPSPRMPTASLERVPFFCLPPEISSPEMLTPAAGAALITATALPI